VGKAVEQLLDESGDGTGALQDAEDAADDEDEKMISAAASIPRGMALRKPTRPTGVARFPTESPRNNPLREKCLGSC